MEIIARIVLGGLRFILQSDELSDNDCQVKDSYSRFQRSEGPSWRGYWCDISVTHGGQRCEAKVKEIGPEDF